MTDVLALDDEIVCKEEERDEYGPMHTDEYEVKEWILEQSAYSMLGYSPKWTGFGQIERSKRLKVDGLQKDRSENKKWTVLTFWTVLYDHQIR